VHLLGFNIEIYYDARSYKRQIRQLELQLQLQLQLRLQLQLQLHFTYILSPVYELQLRLSVIISHTQPLHF